jgi:hypothetical protein
LSKSHARANENMRRVFFFQRTGYCHHVNGFEGKQLRLELQLQIRTSEKTVPLQGKESQTWLLMYWHHACLPKAICSIKHTIDLTWWSQLLNAMSAREMLKITWSFPRLNLCVNVYPWVSRDGWQKLANECKILFKDGCFCVSLCSKLWIKGLRDVAVFWRWMRSFLHILITKKCNLEGSGWWCMV